MAQTVNQVSITFERKQLRKKRKENELNYQPISRKCFIQNKIFKWLNKVKRMHFYLHLTKCLLLFLILILIFDRWEMRFHCNLINKFFKCPDFG